MFEQVFKNIDNKLRADGGVSGQAGYVEQTSWLLFLRYLEDLERDRKATAEMRNEDCTPILEKKYRWNTWAYPLDKKRELDDNALTGDDLINFVNNKLFPYLKSFKQKDISINSLEYKIGEIFGEITNRIKSGYNLRDIIDLINTLSFGTRNDRHELSALYEDKIQNMGKEAPKDGGQFYTPRPLIRAIIKAVNPKIGETIYDGAAGSAGFLVEAYEDLFSQNLTTSENEILQKNTLYAQEKSPLPYIIGMMNMILHGIEAPNFIHKNTLEENVQSLSETDRYNVILANPPFGGKENREVRSNFTVHTSETATLFMQHFMRKLKQNGRAGIVIKNTFLSNSGADTEVRKELLEDFNLHTILEVPAGTFSAGVKTVVLFFQKGETTKDIWYYQLNLGRTLGKTNPLNDDDLKEFIELYKERKDSPNSWTVRKEDIDKKTVDLSVKNPNVSDEILYREPKEIIDEMKNLDRETESILTAIERLL